jgi:hypothetical protein
MRRREFIALAGGLPFWGGSTLWRRLAPFFWRPQLDEGDARTITAVIDLMFPGDGLPGASELGIHNRIVAMADLHAIMAYGVIWLDRQAASLGASGFLGLDEAGRTAALAAAFASEDDDARQFALSLRTYGGLNYYSEPAIKAAFAYTGPPQPGGFPDFRDSPR